MKKFSKVGIYTGTALIPILPFITDSDENIELIIKQTKDNGGKFVLAGGLVVNGLQSKSFYQSLEKYDRKLVERYKGLYQNQYSPQDNSWAVVGRKVKILCKKYGLAYRIKRFIQDSPLSVNKNIAEQLFLKVYELELNEANQEQIEKYRKLAWSIDELQTPITDILREQKL